MNTKDLSVDMSSDTEEIKHFHHIFPRIHISILTHYFIIEPISLS